MSGNHEKENELTTDLEQIKESTNKLETLFADMKAALIKSIICNQGQNDTETK